MTAHPVTIEGSADVYEAFGAIKEAGVRRLPVLEDGDPGGIVTSEDLVVALVLELGAVASPMAREVLGPQSRPERP